MSGGSGSRVNSYTRNLINQQQRRAQELSEYAFAQLPSEVDPIEFDWDCPPSPVQDPPDEPQLNFLDQPEPECPYATMAPGTIKITKIYDRHSTLARDPAHCKLARQILRDSIYPGAMQTQGDLDYWLDKIAEDSNFEVLEYSTVQNKALFSMCNMYKEQYAIEDERTHYHGSRYADSIVVEGLRGACCVRKQYGEGIYTSPNFFQALSYCPEHPITGLMHVVILRTLVGLHQVGGLNQVNYGIHPSGKPFNTLTNETKDIFVHKNESQLCPVGWIVLRYRHEHKTTDAHRKFVVHYNVDLTKRIRLNNDPEGFAAAAAAAAAPAPAPAAVGSAPFLSSQLRWDERPHHHFYIGLEVEIKHDAKLDIKFHEYRGFRGTVEKVFARGSDFRIFVRLTFDAHGNPVKAGTDVDLMQKNHGCMDYLQGPARQCLPCKPSNIDYYNATRAEYLKRQAAGQPEEQPAAGAKKRAP